MSFRPTRSGAIAAMLEGAMSKNDPVDIRRGIDELERALRTRSVREWLIGGDLPEPWEIEALMDLLEERVYTQVPKPWPLLPRELAECVRDQIVVHKSENGDRNVERLLSVVKSRCDCREKDLSLILPLPILRWAKEAWPVDLVVLPSGVRLAWHGLQREYHTLENESHALMEVQAHFRLYGHYSPLAANQAAESVSALLRSLCPIMFNYALFNTAGRLNNLLGPEYEYGGSAGAIKGHLMATNEPLDVNSNPDDEKAIEQVVDLSSDVRSVMGHVSELIESVFLPTSGKKSSGTIERRLANAVELILCASDLQTPSVRLALYVAAIEAVACSKEEGIAEELSNNCATLLLPDSSGRLAAIKAIKQLYGIRSKALHGEQMAATPSDVVRAQELCGAVLTAVIEWKSFSERLDNMGNRQSFLDAISEARITGKPLTGIPERLEAGLAWVKRVESTGNQGPK
jgi:hypothetical protein